jgi:putative transposase
VARLARLVVAGQAHLLIQRGVAAQAIVQDDEDRRGWLAALREAALSQRVAVHAWALLDSEAQLLATPPDAAALGRMMQMLGRRHVGAFNRRHGRRGTLFEGRFRGTVVEGGAWRLAALCWVDGLPALRGAAGSAPETQAQWSSAPHHLGLRRDPWLSDPPEYWQLGNTPFERESAFRALWRQGLPAAQAARLEQGALHGWAVGSPAFIAELAAHSTRPLVPRPRGRPRAGTGNAA